MYQTVTEDQAKNQVAGEIDFLGIAVERRDNKATFKARVRIYGPNGSSDADWIFDPVEFETFKKFRGAALKRYAVVVSMPAVERSHPMIRQERWIEALQAAQGVGK